MIHDYSRRLIRKCTVVGMLVGLWLFITPARAQLTFTEIMANPSGSEGPWEWIEIYNMTGQQLDLDGYVLDDDQFNPLTAANIHPNSGNALILTGGVAVLYNVDDLSAQRFFDAWGGGITLIGVLNFPSLLNSGERIGLWPSLEQYGQRNFDNAVADLDFSAENIFPIPSNGQSIAWTGMGSSVDPFRWIASDAGDSFGAYASAATSITAQINSTNDIANPGSVPNTPAAPGLLITEIMYNPASPDADFEFVEILNNTGAAIDFSVTPYVLDDSVGTLSEENVSAGLVADGEVAVLFDGALSSATDLQTAWGADINFIPVASWSSLNNSGGDTIAIWSDFGVYESDRAADTTAGAVAAVAYENDTNGWPNDDGDGSIYLIDLGADAQDGANWRLSGSEDPGDGFTSRIAMPIVTTTVDNPGTDFGSPSIVPGVVIGSNDGDYNSDGEVNAADYTVWRDLLGESVSSFSRADGDGSGVIDLPDYEHWKSRYVDVVGSESHPTNVSEPSSTALILLAAVGAWLRWNRDARLSAGPLQRLGQLGRAYLVCQ